MSAHGNNPWRTPNKRADFHSVYGLAGEHGEWCYCHMGVISSGERVYTHVRTQQTHCEKCFELCVKKDPVPHEGGTTSKAKPKRKKVKNAEE